MIRDHKVCVVSKIVKNMYSRWKHENAAHSELKRIAAEQSRNSSVQTGGKNQRYGANITERFFSYQFDRTNFSSASSMRHRSPT